MRRRRFSITHLIQHNLGQLGFIRRSDVLSGIVDMLRLTWHAAPATFVAIGVVVIISGLVPVGLTWVTKQLFDLLGDGLRGMLEGGLRGRLWPIVSLQGLLFVLNRMTDPINRYLTGDIGRKVTYQVHDTIYSKINSFVGIAYFEDSQFHDTLRLATNGAGDGPLRTIESITQLVRSTVTIVTFVSILVVISPLITVLIFLLATPRLLTEFRFGRERFQLATELSTDERRVFYNAHLLSSTETAREIRLFGLGNHFLEQMLRAFGRIHNAQSKQQLRELRLTLLQEAGTVLGYGIVFGLFILLVVRTIDGQFSLGDISLYVGAIASMQLALNTIVTSLAGLNEHALFFSHFRNLQNLQQPIQIAQSPRPITTLQGEIELRNVSFRYTDEQPWILRNVDLIIPAGECLALVGVNGAGKTTLVKLLSRLYDPNEGQILWDGIDIRDFDPAELRRNLGVVPQDFLRYALSAYENIGLGDIENLSNSDAVQTAADRSGVHELIENLPAGYNTILSRWLFDKAPGIDLSGGQWQRIALARIFMRNASMLILDEPTAALDAEAEFDVYQRFTNLVTGRTSLLISHRFSTVKVADLVAVLEDGCVTEYGSHAELLARDATYAKLYRVQAERYDDLKEYYP